MSGGRRAGVAVAVGAAVLAPFLVDPFTESILVTTAVFVVLALAWNLMAGYGGLLSFGLAGFFGMGAYTFAILSVHTALPLPVKLLAGALVAALTGTLLMPCFRMRGMYFAIATLAVAESLRVVARNYFPGESTGLYFEPSYDVRGHAAYWWALGAVLVTVLVCIGVRRSRLGHALAALKADPDAAEALGVDTFATRTAVTLLSSAFAGTAGALLASSQAFVDPETYFAAQSYSLVPLLMVIVGGMGTLAGPVIGAIGWQVLDEVLRSVTTTTAAAAISSMVYGAVLVVFAVYAPSGLLGLARAVVDRRRPPSPPDDDGSAPARTGTVRDTVREEAR